MQSTYLPLYLGLHNDRLTWNMPLLHTLQWVEKSLWQVVECNLCACPWNTIGWSANTIGSQRNASTKKGFKKWPFYFYFFFRSNKKIYSFRDAIKRTARILWPCNLCSHCTKNGMVCNFDKWCIGFGIGGFARTLKWVNEILYIDHVKCSNSIHIELENNHNVCWLTIFKLTITREFCITMRLHNGLNLVPLVDERNQHIHNIFSCWRWNNSSSLKFLKKSI